MTLSLISFPTPDGLILHGVEYRPKQTKRALIYLHGNGHSSVFTKSSLFEKLSNTLDDLDCGLIAFNNRGALALQKIKRVEGDDVIVGSSLETIDQAQLDIAGALSFAKAQGYAELFLYGHSSGANKIVTANAKERLSDVAGIILSAGGDDTGLWYTTLGAERFDEALQTARQRVQEGRGSELISPLVTYNVMSYQSLADVLDPDGDYNCFPFSEATGKMKISTKPLFHAVQKITQPTLVVYGSEDHYSVVPAQEAARILQTHLKNAQSTDAEIIKGADHSYSNHQAEISQVIANWISQQVEIKK